MKDPSSWAFVGCTDVVNFLLLLVCVAKHEASHDDDDDDDNDDDAYILQQDMLYAQDVAYMLPQAAVACQHLLGHASGNLIKHCRGSARSLL